MILYCMQKIVSISGPSGVGKSTIINKLLELYPEKYGRFLSYTSRPMRDYEVNGIHYHFISDDQFKEYFKNGEIFERSYRHGTENGPFWGMGKKPLQLVLDQGLNALNDVETEGVKALKKLYPGSYISIFVNIEKEDIIKRLTDRGGTTCDEVQRRLDDYDGYFTEMELFDHVVYNKDLNKCVSEIHKIVCGD